MRYITAKTAIARSYGFDPSVHYTSGDCICLNEKEVVVNPRLKGSVEERVKMLDGKLMHKYEALSYMKSMEKQS